MPLRCASPELTDRGILWQCFVCISPRKEWHFARDLTWDGQKVSETVGGYVKDGREFVSDCH